MEKAKFIKNAAILTVTSLALRTVGMVFRIYLSNKIGAEGMGLYQLIFSVYMLVATFATSGICTAVTRMVADQLQCGTARSLKRTMRLALLGVTAVSAATVVLLLAFADAISLWWIGDIRAAASVRILSFSLPFMGISSCARGYYIACRNVTVPSAAQFTEQIVRIVVIMALIGCSAGRGLEYSCAAVLIGDTVAEAAGCMLVYIGYRRDRKHRLAAMPNGAAAPALGRTMLSIAVPITAGKYLTSLLRTFENLFVPDRLCRYGMARSDAVSCFGMLKGMALPILFFPASFLTALSTLLVPEVSSAAASGNKAAIRSSVKRSVEITLSTAAVIGGIFWVCSQQLGRVLYGSEEVGRYIRVLAPLTPLMYLESVVDGILKGLGQQNHSLGYNVVDSLVRITLITVIVPRFGMDGFLAVMVVSNLLTPLLCLYRLLKVSEVRLAVSDWLIRPTVCVALSALLAQYLAVAIVPDIVCICAVAVTVLGMYAALMWISGGLDAFRFGQPRPVTNKTVSDAE